MAVNGDSTPKRGGPRGGVSGGAGPRGRRGAVGGRPQVRGEPQPRSPRRPRLDVPGGGGCAGLRAGSRHGPGVLRRRGQLHRLQRGPRRAQQRLLRGRAQRGAARLPALHHLPHSLHR